ncbi:NAD-dependent epimerase/dehydratase family protein [Butyrivibrio sp. NC2002]|uniref:NAD-dependent epimerase/dehydratase family protein n=1 Tax=Butyrivibrio sp. NC2002 TaxID=1410610 RepID=UPI00056102CD|nr:NAD(P)-dependent oxidoreductase [Butyrivibrio sp. NC2002]
MRIIVTGASGPIGVPLIYECIKRKIEVLAIVRKHSPRVKNIPQNSLVQVRDCGIENIFSLEKEAKDKYDAIIHLAWTHTKGEDRKNSLLQVKNIELSLSVAEFARKIGCEVFVGAGSQSEYGILNGIASEETPVNPWEAYGMAKLASGQLILNHLHNYGMRACWVRIFSTYGPFENEYTFISYLIRTLMEENVPNLTQGMQVWDYLYIEDAVNALILLATDKNADGVYCLGGSNPRSVKKYVEAIRDIVRPGYELPFGNIPYGTRQSMHLEADITKIKHDVGFYPQIDFEEGIKRLYRWYKGEYSF